MPKILGTKISSINASTELVKKGKRRVPRTQFQQTFLILSDTLADTDIEIRATTGVPPLFYPSGGCVCIKHDPREIEQVVHPVTGVAAALWELTAHFSNDIDPDDEQPPEARRPVVNWTYETEEEVLEKDAVTGAPIKTAAGEPIVITQPVPVAVLHIQRYEVFPWDHTTIYDYGFRVNSEAFWGYPPGHALMMPMEASEEVIEQEVYNVVSYTIKFKAPRQDEDEPWKAFPLHRGTKYFPNIVFQIAEVHRDRYGQPTPVNLTAPDPATNYPGGEKLADDADPVYLEFNRFQRVDFNQLSLGPF